MPSAKAKIEAKFAAEMAKRAACQAASQAALIENVPLRSPFPRLVNEIHYILGTHGGIAVNDPAQKQIEKLLRKYKSDEQAWWKYVFPDPKLPFTRNLVAGEPGKYNLVLQGTLFETRYEWPDRSEGLAQLKIREMATHKRDQVSYMSDKHGLHRIYNPEPFEYAVSLHAKTIVENSDGHPVYTPPNAAIDGCRVFDEATGESKHVKEYSFHSQYGKPCGS
ncbi:MAG: hypothetical protein Q9174_002907 [Haloplaca sp. 1 TL-2023]